MRFEIPAGAGKQKLAIEAPAAANLNYFLKTPLTPITSANVVNKQCSVKGYQRRTFPGDAATTTVVSSQREYLYDPSRRSGNALGGFTFRLVGDPGMPNEEAREFTLVEGRVMDLHAFLVANAKMLVYLYTGCGARYTIGAAAAGPYA